MEDASMRETALKIETNDRVKVRYTGTHDVPLDTPFKLKNSKTTYVNTFAGIRRLSKKSMPKKARRKFAAHLRTLQARQA
jgi:uncharacterized protein YxeA